MRRSQLALRLAVSCWKRKEWFIRSQWYNEVSYWVKWERIDVWVRVEEEGDIYFWRLIMTANRLVLMHIWKFE